MRNLTVFLILLILNQAFAAETENKLAQWKKAKKLYYSYFLNVYAQEAATVKALWQEKYKQVIKAKKHWEIPLRKLYPQGNKPDCVPTCIAMLADYYYIDHDPPWQIGRRIRTQQMGRQLGTPVYNLLAELKRMGLQACAYPGTLTDLKEKLSASTPIIVLQQYKKEIPGGHARLVVGFNDLKQNFIVIDPNFGNRKFHIPYDEFQELWAYSSCCTILAFKITAK